MKIGINGGLGNQLFQIAFAHATGESISLFIDSNPREDRPYELELFRENCSHIVKVHKNNIFVNWLKIKLARIPQKLHLNFLFKAFSFLSRTELERYPFSYLHIYKKRNQRLYLGYFQHWRNVEDGWNHLSLEIMKTLENVFLGPIFDLDLESTIFIHVRCGDLINVSKTMGILGPDYYREAIRLIQIKNPQTNFQIIALTDDKAWARKMGLELNISDILGPDDMTAWQTLKLMSMAKYLVCANSTLSWWGAYLSSKSNGTTFMPDPWFKNWKEPVGDAFYFPKSFLAKSWFVDL